MTRKVIVLVASVMWSLLSLAPVSGQVFGTGVRIDSAVRPAVLWTTQTARYEKVSASASIFKVDYNTLLPLTSGMVEVTPHAVFSGRVSGSVSFLEPDFNWVHGTGVDSAAPFPSRWSVTPHFISGDIAVLYHVWRGAGYRFCLVGGWRKERWEYSGDPIGNQGYNSKLADEFTSEIPFAALQTAVAFPWWKARFELLGSPFVNTEVYTLIRDGVSAVDYHGWTNDGGLIEMELEGSITLSPNIRVGAYSRWSFIETYGDSTRHHNGQVTLHDLYVRENRSIAGLNINLIF